MSELDPIQQSAQAQFDCRSGHYGTRHILADVTDVAEALEPLNLSVPSEALDVAAGAGHTGLYLAGLGHRVTLADITPKMLKEAQALAEARGLTVTTREHPAEAMPFPSASFDLVTCRVSAHHFSRPEAFLSETARVLRPGGFLVLIDGTVEDDRPEAEAWLHEVEKARDPSHKQFLTPLTWQRLCQAEGLRVSRAAVNPFKQPDLEWYLDVAGTAYEGRRRVWELVENVPDAARAYFQVAWEGEKLVWWWPRLTLVASEDSDLKQRRARRI